MDELTAKNASKYINEIYDFTNIICILYLYLL